MNTTRTYRLIRSTLVALALVALVGLSLAGARPAQAAGEVQDCSFSGLATALNSGNGLITFNCKGTHAPATISVTQLGGLNVDGPAYWTIDGGNLITLTGLNQYRLFNVKAGGALTLTNITLTQGYAGSNGYIPTRGGALLNNGGRLVLEHATLRDSQSTGSGGAIESLTGTTSLIDSRLLNNIAPRGGAIDSLTGTLLITHSLLQSNTVSGGGGGGLWTAAPNARIVNSDFRNNRAFTGPLGGTTTGYGGAIDNQGTLSITNSTVDYNYAQQGGGGIQNDLGATSLYSVQVAANIVSNDCGFFGVCTGIGYGGGIDNNGGTVTLEQSEVEGNQVITGTGGAIYNSGSLSVLDLSRLDLNSAANGGGGIYSTNRLTISKSFILGNYIGCFPCLPTSGSGGGLYLSGSSFITLSLFSNNRSTLDGGAIYNAGALTVTLTDFDSNAAPGNGGAIENRGTATLVDSDFENHQTAQRGGALSNNLGTLIVRNGHITSNSAHFGGGLTNSGVLTVTGAVLDRNSARAGGGLLSSGSLFMTGTTVSNNQAQNNGGVADGGGLWLTGTVAVQQSTIATNAADNGGGIYMQGYGFLFNLTVRDNTAITNGGGVYFALTSISALDDSTISGNRANNFGGGIYEAITPGYARTFQGLNIVGNYAGCWGGGLFHYVGNLTVFNSTLSGNMAFCQGGGIYHFSGKLSLVNVTLSGNAADRGGGLSQQDIASLVNVTLSDNSANQGGGLWMQGGTTTFLTNTIVANSHTGGNCAGPVTSSIFSISSDFTCALAGMVKGLNPNNLDPQLSALGDYGGATPLRLPVHMPKAGSPAIDGVLGSNALAVDERSFLRPQGSGYDIGAVERQPADVDTIPRLRLPLIVR